MAERPDARTVLRAPVVVRGPRDIDASSGRLAIARATGNLSRAFERNASLAGKEVGRQMRLEETRLGKEAGLSAGASETTELADGTIVPTVTLRDENTLFSQAYNRAALETADNRFKVAIREGVSKLGREHFADPEGLDGAARALFEGLSSGIPEESQSKFENIFSSLLTAEVENQSTQLVQQTADRQRASNLEGLAEIGALTDRLSRDLTSVNPDLALASSRAVADARDDLVGLLDQETPTGRPIYTDTEKARALLQFETRVVRGSVKGAFDRATDKQGFIDNWLEGQKNFRGASTIDIDQAESLAAEMQAQLNREQSRNAVLKREVRADASDVVMVLQSGVDAAGYETVRQQAMALGDTETVDKLDLAHADLEHMQQFSQLPSGEQAINIARLEDKANTGGLTIAESRRFDAMRAQHARQIKALASNPLAYAANVRLIDDIAPLGTFSEEELTARDEQVRFVSEHFKVPVPFLLDGEKDALIARLGVAEPEQIIALLENFSMLPTDRQRDIAAELAPKSPEIGRAIQLAGQDNGQDSASLLISGYQLGLRPESKLLKPSTSQMRLAISNEFGDIGGGDPGVFASFAASTESIYIGLAASKGVTDVDESLLADAAKLAAGGMRVGDGVVGGTMEIHGKRTLPFAIGTTEEDFETLLNSFTTFDLRIYSDNARAPVFADGTRLTPEMITSGFGGLANLRGLFVSDPFFFEPAGQGKYLLRTPAGTYVQTATGAYVIDLGRAWEDGRAHGAPAAPPEEPPSIGRTRDEPGLFELDARDIEARQPGESLEEFTGRQRALAESAKETIQKALKKRDKERAKFILKRLEEKDVGVFERSNLKGELLDMAGLESRRLPGGPAQQFLPDKFTLDEDGNLVVIRTDLKFSDIDRATGMPFIWEFLPRRFGIDAAGRFVGRRHPRTTVEERRKLLERQGDGGP